MTSWRWGRDIANDKSVILEGSGMGKAKSRSSRGGKSKRSSSSKGNYRSAKSGRYATEKYAKSHPNTTVKESK